MLLVKFNYWICNASVALSICGKQRAIYASSQESSYLVFPILGALVYQVNLSFVFKQISLVMSFHITDTFCLHVGSLVLIYVFLGLHEYSLLDSISIPEYGALTWHNVNYYLIINLMYRL